MFFSNNLNWAFQVTGSFDDCPNFMNATSIRLNQTREGLYVSSDKQTLSLNKTDISASYLILYISARSL